MDALAAALMVEAALVDQLTAALRQAPITVASPTRPVTYTSVANLAYHLVPVSPFPP
jgi:hypothetical protein